MNGGWLNKRGKKGKRKKEYSKSKISSLQEEESQKGTRIEMEQEDLDYWPDDWEDEDGWEE